MMKTADGMSLSVALFVCLLVGVAYGQSADDCTVASLGCWKDTGSRAIPTLEGKGGAKKLLDGSYTRRANALEKCKKAAIENGFRVFALQNGGWCASSADAENTYKKHGKKTGECPEKGASWTNHVYKITCEGDSCSQGAVKLGTDGSPYLFLQPSPEVEGSWWPICGHYFWDNKDGATAFCKRLGYSSGTVDRTRSTYSKASIFVGKCRANEGIMACSGAANSYATNSGSCAVGQKVSIKVNCGGAGANVDASEEKKSCQVFKVPTDDCFAKCGSKSGHCPQYCGKGNGCCKKDDPTADGECKVANPTSTTQQLCTRLTVPSTMNAFQNGDKNPELYVKENWKTGQLVGDEKFPNSKEILTWTAPGVKRGNQWIGYKSPRYSFKKLTYHFFVKFEKAVPAKTANIGIKVYGKVYNDWMATCEPDEWCEVTKEIEAPGSGDGYMLLIIWDNVLPKDQVIHIADWSIKTLFSRTDNIARFKKTWQSSEGWNGPSSKATDGIDTTHYHSGSCTHTHRDNKARWSVDLGKVYEIEKVVVYNRMDCCSERLNNFVVEIQDNYMRSVAECGKAPEMKGKASYTMECSKSSIGKGPVGQIVSVYLPGKQYLTLCEVKVFGKLVADQPPARVDIALKKPTTQSSECCNGPSRLAVDGKIFGNYHMKSCTHTHRDTNPWWRVNLGGTYEVKNVQVFNRLDSHSERLNNFAVLVLDERAKIVDECGRGGIMKDVWMKFLTCKKGLIGNYVEIMIDRQEHLTLCEVKVEGTLQPGKPAGPPTSCDFDKSSCGFELGTAWQLNNRYTPSLDTGPDEDAGNQGGYYVYFEGSGTPAGKYGVLRTHALTSGGYCMKFKYHMKGKTMGTLSVHTETNQDISKPLFEVSGEQGSKWKSGQVFVNSAAEFKVAFVAHRGDSWESDIALDEITFTPGQCQSDDVEEADNFDTLVKDAEIAQEAFKRAMDKLQEAKRQKRTAAKAVVSNDEPAKAAPVKTPVADDVSSADDEPSVNTAESDDNVAPEEKTNPKGFDSEEASDYAALILKEEKKEEDEPKEGAVEETTKQAEIVNNDVVEEADAAAKEMKKEQHQEDINVVEDELATAEDELETAVEEEAYDSEEKQTEK